MSREHSEDVVAFRTIDVHKQFENAQKADFRAFRREIVLAIVASGKYITESDRVETVWEAATRIARAEPKGGENG